jgi:hypothetical protein
MTVIRIVITRDVTSIKDLESMMNSPCLVVAKVATVT